MHVVSVDAVTKWASVGSDYRHPVAMSLDCPFCTVRGTFVFSGAEFAKNCHTVSVHGKCPTCQESVYVWSVNAPSREATEPRRCECLLVYPSPHRPRLPIQSAELMPPRIRRAYEETLGVFNARIWNATATSGRRTLEGILSDLVPDEKGPLYTRLKNLPSSVDLGQPLVTLSDLVRQGGNLGAHFDSERDLDPDTAEAILNLIEYLLEYLYTLPLMIGKLKYQLNPKDTDDSVSTTP